VKTLVERTCVRGSGCTKKKDITGKKKIMPYAERSVLDGKRRTVMVPKRPEIRKGGGGNKEA